MSTAGAEAVADPGAPAEGEAADLTETPATEPAGDAAAAEPAVEEHEGDKPEEGKPEPSDAELSALAEKYAKDLWKTANRTMAAARRAEKQVAEVKAHNETLKGHLQTYASFVERVKNGDPGALKELGFGTVKQFLDKVIAFGETPVDTAETRLERLEREQKERVDAEKRQKHEALVAEEKKKLFDAIDGDKGRWKYTATKLGHEELWTAIGEYVGIHGDIDQAGVHRVADAVEKMLRDEFGAANTDSAARPAAKAGAPAGSAEKKNSGRTLNNAATSGAPVEKELPLDPVLRKQAVNEELRAQGLL